LIELKEYTTYNEKEILALYKAVEWSNYYKEPQMMKKAYQSSLYIVGAYLKNTLVGIIRVVGDGASIVFIQDLLVHPDNQRQGIGSQLLLHILDKYQGVKQKALLTDDSEQTKAFYSTHGLTPIQETKGICFVKYSHSL
jgi:GNAT superfamily N-acetyltransferase